MHEQKSFPFILGTRWCFFLFLAISVVIIPRPVAADPDNEQNTEDWIKVPIADLGLWHNPSLSPVHSAVPPNRFLASKGEANVKTWVVGFIPLAHHALPAPLSPGFWCLHLEERSTTLALSPKLAMTSSTGTMRITPTLLWQGGWVVVAVLTWDVSRLPQETPSFTAITTSACPAYQGLWDTPCICRQTGNSSLC